MEDYVTSLASDYGRLSYDDFKEDIESEYPNTDDGRVEELYRLYEQQRRTIEETATAHLMRLIDEGRVPEGKTEAQLFQLKAFKERYHQVDHEAIHQYYLRHYDPSWTPERQALMDMQKLYNRALKDADKRARTHTSKVNINKFYTRIMEGLDEGAIEELYERYVTLWDKRNKDPNATPTKTLKEHIDSYVIIHPHELLSYEDFNKVSRAWDSNITRQQAYQYYQESFFRLHPETVRVTEPKHINRLGFKDKNKYMFGKRVYEKNPISTHITNYFPLKENLKKYGLHKVAPRGTYVIDFAFADKLVFLVAINANTRYGMIELMNVAKGTGEEIEQEIVKKDAKTTTTYLRTLEKMMREVSLTNPIKHLNGDGDVVFVSNLASAFYRERGIKFHPAPRMKIEDPRKKKGYKTEPLHSSLALVDRLIRTLRDMAFNANYPLTPLVLKEMMRQYNNAPHSTLSKWIGFPCSPLMVQQDKNKEEYIVMKIMKENALTSLSNDFDLPVGAAVKVYAEKDAMGKRRRLYKEGKIVGKDGLLFRVNTKFGDEVVPRYKLMSIY